MGLVANGWKLPQGRIQVAAVMSDSRPTNRFMAAKLSYQGPLTLGKEITHLTRKQNVAILSSL